MTPSLAVEENASDLIQVKESSLGLEHQEFSTMGIGSVEIETLPLSPAPVETMWKEDETSYKGGIVNVETPAMGMVHTESSLNCLLSVDTFTGSVQAELLGSQDSETLSPEELSVLEMARKVSQMYPESVMADTEKGVSSSSLLESSTYSFEVESSATSSSSVETLFQDAFMKIPTSTLSMVEMSSKDGVYEVASPSEDIYEEASLTNFTDEVSSHSADPDEATSPGADIDRVLSSSDDTDEGASPSAYTTRAAFPSD